MSSVHLALLSSQNRSTIFVVAVGIDLFTVPRPATDALHHIHVSHSMWQWPPGQHCWNCRHTACPPFLPSSSQHPGEEHRRGNKRLLNSSSCANGCWAQGHRARVSIVHILCLAASCIGFFLVFPGTLIHNYWWHAWWMGCRVRRCAAEG